MRFKFECKSPNDKEPILLIKTSLSVPVENIDNEVINFLRLNFYEISLGWYIKVNSYKINIFNADNEIIFLVNSKGKIVQVPIIPPGEIRVF